jgi:hypothetical protein
LGAADKGGERQVDGVLGGRAGGTEVGEEAGAKPSLSEDEVFFCLSLSVCHTVSIRAFFVAVCFAPHPPSRLTPPAVHVFPSRHISHTETHVLRCLSGLNAPVRVPRTLLSCAVTRSKQAALPPVCPAPLQGGSGRAPFSRPCTISPGLFGQSCPKKQAVGPVLLGVCMPFGCVLCVFSSLCPCVCVCVLICIDICACMYTGLGSTARSQIPSGAEPGSRQWD